MESEAFNFKIIDIRSLKSQNEPKVYTIEDKPLLNLIKDVLNIRKSNLDTLTITNIYLLNILTQEFNITIDNMSEFEIDVYLSVLKTYLKIWPKWDTLDKEVIKDSDNNENLNNVYKSLKKYLSDTILETKESIVHLQKTISERIKEDDDEVVLKVTCVRQQLNGLFYNKPTPQGNIFHVIHPVTYLEEFNFEEIINFPMVKTTLFLPGIKMYHQNNSPVDRTLMNLKCLKNSIIKDMPHSLKKNRVDHRSCSEELILSKVFVLEILHKMLSNKSRILRAFVKELFEVVLQQFIQDISMAPDSIKSGEYRIILHDYKYIRNLSVKREAYEDTDVNKRLLKEDIDVENFDLQLQELLTPQIEFCINDLSLYDEYNQFHHFVKNEFLHNEINMYCDWLQIDCLICDLSFKLPISYDQMIAHFNKEHHSELDWECTGCHKSFNMVTLSKNRWTHTCSTVLQQIDYSPTRLLPNVLQTYGKKSRT